MTAAAAIAGVIAQPRMLVDLSPTTLSATAGTVNITTADCFSSVSYSVGSVSYLWAVESGGTGITIQTPTGSSTTFRAAGLSIGEIRTGTYSVTATDAVGAVKSINNVTVTIERT